MVKLMLKIFSHNPVPQVVVKSENAQIISLGKPVITASSNASKSFSSQTKRMVHAVIDFFNPKVKHFYNNSGVLVGIKELKFKDKDGLIYHATAYCENGKIISRTLYDNKTKQIVKKYLYSPKKKEQVLKEEFFEKGKFSHSLTHEYDCARATHTVTQKDSKNTVESIKIFNLFFPDHLMKEIKPNK